jgi:enolase-phosphatase E1
MTAIQAIVTDIEGTTTSIDFVHKVLFPYAARAMPDFLRSRKADPDIAPLLDAVRKEAGEPQADVERLIGILLRWIGEDRKVTALKALQGHIWEHGYRTGALTGHVYEDAARNLRDWQAGGIALYVFSSGSVKAQQLLLGHSDAGDLRPLFSGYFDTAVGAKRDTASYRIIGEQIGLPAGEVLFLSDIAEELDAAAAAGMNTVQLARGSAAVAGAHAVAQDFDAVPITKSG